MTRCSLMAVLFATTAFAALCQAQGARAAENDAAAVGAAAPPQAVLGELIVTATKQSATVNKVPLSITAQTQANLDQQGVKTVQDLARTVPALQITTSNTPNGANIAIRGIASSIGASTTAVYLDDVPLQRRTTLGAFSGSGVIFPQLFDLERVEVLRGPQGTLYGGSAEGGAVRFITPTPSVTTYSAYLRGEASGTRDGGLNHEFGAAAGGPLVTDKLGARFSVVLRRDGGWLDHVDEYTGAAFAKNTNAETRNAYRGELLWKPLPRLDVTASVYSAVDHHEDTDNYWENVAATTVATARYNAAGVAYNGSNGPINFTLPGHTYGPYNVFGPYKSGANCNIGENFKDLIAPCYEGSPRTSGLTVVSLTGDYDFGPLTAHLTSAYVVDSNKGQNDGSFGETSGYQGGVPFLYTFPEFLGRAIYKNRRTGVTEEFRLASPATGRLSWVAGAFYSYQFTKAESHDYTLDGPFAPYLRGVPDVLVYGAPVAANGDITARVQYLKEKEIAGFGEANLFILPNLKLILGGRYAYNTFSYNTQLAGAFFGYAVPTAANGGLSAGVQAQSSFLPKAGLQYDISPTANVYFTASKGFRMGGVNTGPYQFKCQSVFASLGISDTPRQFGSDSLWSYEVGAKAKVMDRAQVNASAFYITWDNIQVAYTLPAPCSFSYTTNAGGAISEGGDIQAQVKLFGGLSASILAAYTDAYYSSALVGPAPTFSTFINKGDTLPVPGWSANLGLRYDFTAPGEMPGYARIDYQYQGAYKRGFGPGSSSYNADTYQANEARYVSARAALDWKDLEFSLFATNLLNSQDVLARTGGRACANAGCTVVRSNNPIFVDTTFQPQTIGIAVSYRR